ncbi:MAG: leucine-rich repeat domain-containing protein [Oscillospiraceae bacterium]|nr:leucine-rich repeat domain-containing protein [Oscillospiraceae bacterium]
MKKRKICAALAVIMALSGCGKAAENIPEAAVTETDLTSASEIVQACTCTSAEQSLQPSETPRESETPYSESEKVPTETEAEETISEADGKYDEEYVGLGYPTDDDLRDLANYKNLKSLGLGLPLPEDTDFSLLNGLESLERITLGGGGSPSYMNMYKLSDARLPGLKSLTVWDEGFFSVAFFPESFPGLESLDIYDCSIEDVNALGSLKNLNRLWLDNCELNDISFVSGLDKLRIFSISNNFVVDISPLAGKASLEFLDISGNPVGDRAGETLKTLSNLARLNTVCCGIGDISFLSGSPKLEELYLGGNPIDDISALGSLENLQDLGLDGTLIDNVEPLRNLQNLWFLNLMNTDITDISPLAECSRLDMIALHGTSVSAEDKAEFFKNNPDKREQNPG